MDEPPPDEEPEQVEEPPEDSPDESLQALRRRRVIRSIKLSLFFCVLVGVLAATATDGGALFQIWYFATAAYWASTGLIWVLHRNTLSRTDVIIVAYGFVIALVTVPFLMNFFWRLYGMA